MNSSQTTSLPLKRQYRVKKAWPGGPTVGSIFIYVAKLDVYMNDNLSMSPNEIAAFSDSFFDPIEDYFVKSFLNEKLFIGDVYFKVEDYRLCANAGGHTFKVGRNTPPADLGVGYFKHLHQAIKYLVYHAPVLTVGDTNKMDLSIPLRYFPADLLMTLTQRIGIPQDLVRKVIAEEVDTRKKD